MLLCVYLCVSCLRLVCCVCCIGTLLITLFAGWPQVQSWSVEPPASGVDAGLRYHLAVNYWYQPPDVLKPEGVKAAYTDPYWYEHWARVEAAIAKDLAARKRTSSTDAAATLTAPVAADHTGKKAGKNGNKRSRE